jgi:hypothetical protein
MKPEITTTRPKSRIDYHNTFEFVHYSTSKNKTLPADSSANGL